jgi:hypothetical protein
MPVLGRRSRWGTRRRWPDPFPASHYCREPAWLPSTVVRLLRNRTGDRRKHVVRASPDEPYGTDYYHQDDRQHDRVFGDVLAFLLLPKPTENAVHLVLLRNQKWSSPLPTRVRMCSHATRWPDFAVELRRCEGKPAPLLGPIITRYVAAEGTILPLPVPEVSSTASFSENKGGRSRKMKINSVTVIKGDLEGSPAESTRPPGGRKTPFSNPGATAAQSLAGSRTARPQCEYSTC